MARLPESKQRVAPEGIRRACSNRNLRNLRTQNIRLGSCRVMGLIKRTPMSAFEVMAANLRVVREWAVRTGENPGPLHESFPEDFGFDENDAEGNVWPVTPDDSSPPGT